MRRRKTRKGRTFYLVNLNALARYGSDNSPRLHLLYNKAIKAGVPRSEAVNAMFKGFRQAREDAGRK